jgi:hypothetical protein
MKKGIPQSTAWRWAFETYPKLVSTPTAEREGLDA